MSKAGMYEGTDPNIPDRFYMYIEGLAEDDAEIVAKRAANYAKFLSPKLTGKGAKQIEPIWGEEYIGLYFPAPHMFYQDAGISPFTMRNLAGKTIPMWIDDPDGEVKRENPKAEQRTMANGRVQTLIFRKAAPIGSRKSVVRNGKVMDVPRSYPGAPGRIDKREPEGKVVRGAKVGGRIARHNVGVRWRHPGLRRKGYLRQALELAADDYGLPIGPVRDSWGRFR